MSPVHPAPPPEEALLDWRLELQDALAQPGLAGFDAGAAPGPSEKRAAYRLAVALGKCRLFGVALGPLDGSLAPSLGLAAAEQWLHYLPEWASDAQRLEDDCQRADDEVEELDRCADLLVARMESWAAFLAIDEAYQESVETAWAEHARFAAVLDEAFAALERFDAELSACADLLSAVAGSRLLENWRKLLAEDFRHSLPWWLGGGLEHEARAVEGAALAWQPRLAGPGPDFRTDPEVVRLVVEGQRLAFGHLVNPGFAIETALIEPLPHQRIAVYHHLLAQPRLRFLLADDAGAGKTIMAGLYVREMLSRRLLRRVLVVVPAGLVGNWERELRTLFNLAFRIVSGNDARPAVASPFTGPASDLVIVSVDTLSGERLFKRLQGPEVEPYELAIFDEAHKLSADRTAEGTLRRTVRYCLAEALTGAPGDDERWALPWSCRHVLLLSATPHMGKAFPYYALWRLLEPEALATFDAFQAYPPAERRQHFLRRTKEEMVRFDGSPIYPTRVSDTLSYELTRGEVSEQELYEQTTEYIREHYNRARVLNRSAARLAMSIFQRRLASSPYALMRSFERRLGRLDAWIVALKEGTVNEADFPDRQDQLKARDVWDGKTGDEEDSAEGREENERAEDEALKGVTAKSIQELRKERDQVQHLLELARRVEDKGDQSKFDRLADALQSERFRSEKVLLFTEFRDTLEFLTRRLEGLGHAGQVAELHGGMDYRAREAQVAFFRKPIVEGGARFLVATDAAGEGINLQVCWLMFNYDVPWNPARLEQRMGRIHRYGQQHDPVVILNLVAGKTREGRVLKTLLDKLEIIRRELTSDKVFDVVGRLFEGLSVSDYMEQLLTGTGEAAIEKLLDEELTADRVKDLGAGERTLYGIGGDVARQLEEQRAEVERERWRRLLPGYVRRFLIQAAPRLGLRIEGDLGTAFALHPEPASVGPLRPLLATYALRGRRPFTLGKPDAAANANGHGPAFLRPGEPLFDRLRADFCEGFAEAALRGAVFRDPGAERPYLFHLALVSVLRAADPHFPALRRQEVLECRLLGLRQDEQGKLAPCAMEQLLLLEGGGAPDKPARLVELAGPALARARGALQEEAARLAEERRRGLWEGLEQRATFLTRGYDYQEAELLSVRARLSEKARAGDVRAKADLQRVRQRQQALAALKEQALATLRCEPGLVGPGEVTFLAHALVVPAREPDDRRRHDVQVEATAVRLAWAFEQAEGALVQDVSTPANARAAGLVDRPGFDLLAHRPGGEQLAIEVKGRSGGGAVELTENEWVQACNHRERYWLYVVYDCATPHPRLLRVQDPFGKLLVRARGRVEVAEQEVLASAERELFVPVAN